MKGEPFNCHLYFRVWSVEAAHVNFTVSPAFGVNVPDDKVREGFSWSEKQLEW